MKDSELQIDRSCHVLYSKPCKKEILAKIALHYPEAERETEMCIRDSLWCLDKLFQLNGIWLAFPVAETATMLVALVIMAIPVFLS